MALVINTNISSLGAQRQLSGSGMTLDRATERLSSGLRVNSAKDDAAGLAIATRMTSQVRGLDQAVRNANDGVSLIQTAEGALQESTNILQRMRELAVQSSNGIYSDSDRKTLDAENKQLIAELDRIAKTTSFNGKNLLDGSLGTVDLQVGASSGQTISFEINAMDSKNLGLGSTSADLTGGRADTAGTADVGQGNIVINGIGLKAITNLGSATAADTQLSEVLADINDNVEGITASGFNIVEAQAAGDGLIGATGGNSITITLGSVDGGQSVAYEITNTTSMQNMVDQINEKAGGALTASLNTNGRLVLSNTTGGTITVAENGTAAGATGITAAAYTGSVALKSDNGEAITVTTGANGTDADLAVLGFRRTEGAGQVLGDTLATGPQNGALANNDLKINGVDIGIIAANAGLQAKVDAINLKSDTTGVSASVMARDSYATNTAKNYQEITSIAATATTAAQNIRVNGVLVTFTGATAALAATDLNALSATTGVKAFVGDDGFLRLASESNVTLTDGTGTVASLLGAGATNISAGVVATGVTNLAATLAAEAGSININGTAVALSNLGNKDTIVTNLNSSSAVTGVTASIDDNGELQLQSNSTITIKYGQTQGFATAFALGITVPSNGVANNTQDDVLTIDPRIKLDSANDTPISVEVTATGATNTGLLNQNTSLASTVTGTAISNLSIATKAGATAALTSIDTALDTINDTRSQLGSINNRLDFTVSNLTSISEKTTAARSRIIDADFAQETANLSRSTVLQQAATAMLAQANQRPQNVLSLLR
jgi:flagellin